MFFLLLACSADLHVVSATADGTLARAETIWGRDGGSSGLVFGQSVFAYGDTALYVDDVDGTNWHTNSYELRDPADWRDDFDTPTDAAGAPRFFVDLTDDEKAWNAAGNPRWALWPSEPLDDGAGGAWTLYGLYSDAGPSGIGVARWSGPDAAVVRETMPDGGWLLFDDPGTEWANAPFVHDGFLYAFGCPLLHPLDRPCELARVALEAVDRREAWTFWDGDRWNADSARAAVLFQGAPIQSASYVPALDRWLVVYAGPFSNDIVARTAPAPEGPWSKETKLFTVDGDAPYDAVHHEELAENDGSTQWITYSRSTGEGWFGAEHVVWRVELTR